MKIDGLGELITDKDIPEWLVSHKIPISYLDGLELNFVLEDIVNEKDLFQFSVATNNFLDMNHVDKLKANKLIFEMYLDFCDSLHEDDVFTDISDMANVWNYIYPTEIHVARGVLDESSIYVEILAECDWDSEHGLKIVYRNGNELVSVSDQS